MSATSRAAFRPSEDLLNDHLLHEEHAKMIDELKKAKKMNDSEIYQLKNAL